MDGFNCQDFPLVFSTSVVPSPTMQPAIRALKKTAARGWSTWDSYKVKPGVALESVALFCGTISGLAGDLNRIVVQYLGRFCTSTHTRYINPAPLADFCNYCQERGHEFDLEECGGKVEGYIEAQHLAERYAREAERRAWRRIRDGVNPL